MSPKVAIRASSLARWVCAAAAMWLLAEGWAAAPATQILALHSYSQDYPWTLAQQQGFSETLAEDPSLEISLSTEYLDTKRRGYDPEYAADLARHLALKYAHYKPSAIYVTDDNALLFARDNLPSVFPGVPVFFSGINDYGVWDTLEAGHFTGAFELKEVEPNIRWLHDLDSRADDFLFVGDGSNTYKAVEVEAKKALTREGLRANFISETRLDRALERVRSLPGKYLFLTTVGGMTDPDGHVLPLHAIVRAFAATGKLVVSMEDGYVMEGVLGGWVTSGQHQGAAAARLLLAYLHGTPVASLAPVRKSPNTYIFDDGAFKNNGLFIPSALRAQAEVLNPRSDFLESHHTEIIRIFEGLTAVLVLALLGGIVALKRNNRDLSEARNSAQEALERLQKIAGRLPGVVYQYLLRPDGTSCFPFASEAIRDIYRVSPEDVRGDASKVFERIHPEDRQAVVESIGESAKNLTPWNKEYRVTQKDGTVRVLRGNSIPEQEADGSVLWHGFITDITSQKRVEEELLATNAHLQKAIARANDLALQAQAANRAKSAFLAAMSHEIRTPLNGILGSMEILARTELKETERELVHMILTSGEVLLSTINDILDFSKIEAGQLKLESVVFDPVEEARKAIEVVTPAARKKGISLDFKPGASVPRQAIGDVTRLRQILVNLAGNAVKFTARGGVTVRCDFLPTGRIRFEVEDTGIGIPAEKIPSLFDAFTQADSSTTRKFGGSGLGLSIAQRLVRLMDGDIQVRSTPGEGSSFSFALDLPSPPAATAPKSFPSSAAPASSTENGGSDPTRILLVEDDEINKRVALILLKDLGVSQVTVASNGKEAVEQWESETFDLVLMDCQMPEMDGNQATRAIRERESARSDGHHQVIVGLSAGALTEDRIASVASGMDLYLTKPVKRADLLGCLQRWGKNPDRYK